MIEQEAHQQCVTLCQEARSRVFEHWQQLYRDFNGLGFLGTHTARAAVCIDVTRLLALDAFDALNVGMCIYVEYAHFIGKMAVGFEGGQSHIDGPDSIALQLLPFDECFKQACTYSLPCVELIVEIACLCANTSQETSERGQVGFLPPDRLISQALLIACESCCFAELFCKC